MGDRAEKVILQAAVQEAEATSWIDARLSEKIAPSEIATWLAAMAQDPSMAPPSMTSSLARVAAIVRLIETGMLHDLAPNSSLDLMNLGRLFAAEVGRTTRSSQAQLWQCRLLAAHARFLRDQARHRDAYVACDEAFRRWPKAEGPVDRTIVESFAAMAVRVGDVSRAASLLKEPGLTPAGHSSLDMSSASTIGKMGFCLPSAAVGRSVEVAPASWYEVLADAMRRGDAAPLVGRTRRGREFFKFHYLCDLFLLFASLSPRGAVAKMPRLRFFKELRKEDGLPSGVGRDEVEAIAAISDLVEAEVWNPALRSYEDLDRLAGRLSDFHGEAMFRIALSRCMTLLGNDAASALFLESASSMIRGCVDDWQATPLGMVLTKEEKKSAAPRGRKDSRVSRTLDIIGLATVTAGDAAVSAAVRKLAPASKTDELIAREIDRHVERLGRHLRSIRGIFVKLGQLAPGFIQHLPESVIDKIRVLQDDVRPIDPRLAREVVEQSLGRPIGEIFATWSDYPVAAASIGQVHRATLPSGEVVAVKVQYPDASSLFRADMASLRLLTPLFKAIFPKANVSEIIDTGLQLFLRECDYRREAESQMTMRQTISGQSLIKIPKVFHELSTDKILTMEFVEGIAFSDFAKYATFEERQKAAQCIVDVLDRAIFIDGIINFDPHPGNFRFTEGSIYWLDFGGVTAADPSLIEYIRSTWLSYLLSDDDGIAREIRRAGFVGGTEFDFGSAISYTKMECESFLNDATPLLVDSAYLDASSKLVGANVKHGRVPAAFLPLMREQVASAMIIKELGASIDRRETGRMVLKHWGIDRG